MNPIEKFTNIDAVYYSLESKEEDTILEYVWCFASLINPSEQKKIDNVYFDGSNALPTFKNRYNDNLIKMPFSYNDYCANKEIQAAVTALKMEADKFWYALLFIWDYVNGECWNVFELEESPTNEINNLINIISKYEDNHTSNPLTEHISFNEELSLSLNVKGKSIYSINTANAIKYIMLRLEDKLEDIQPKEDIEETYKIMEMVSSYPSKKQNTASNTKMICLFTYNLQLFFKTSSPLSYYDKGKKNEYDITFFISQLIYYTKISNNENFLVDKTTLKGYLSKNKKLKWNVSNSIY